VSYCETARGHPLHGPYHDQEHGFPTTEEVTLFERLVLEINQAGLSWEVVLKKRAGFRRAYADFAVDRVAAFGPDDVARLLGDPGIVRHRRKIEAAIKNARRIQSLRETHGSFAGWLAARHPLSKAQWVKLFRKTFVFTGPEIVAEFLMSVGYLPGAHHPDCPVYSRVVAARPPWLDAPAGTYEQS